MFIIKKGNILIVLLLIILNIYFVSRLQYFELSIDNILPFIIGYNFILAINIVGYFFFKDYINPISAYSFFLFCFLFSFIPFSSFQLGFSDYGLIILILSVLFFFLGAIIFQKVKLFQVFPVFTNRSKRIIFYFIVSICIFSFLLEILKLGYIPLFNILKRNVYGDTIKGYTPLLNTFILMSYVIPVWSLLLFRTNIISKTVHRFALLVSIFILLNHLGRQMFLVSGLSIITYLNYFEKIKSRRLLVMISGGILFFLFLGFLRTGSSRAINQNNEVIKRIGDITYETNLLESYLILYSSVRFSVFEEMLEEKVEKDFWGMGLYTFRPLFKITALSKMDYFDQPEFDSYKRLGTYAIEPFLDAGILGVILINFLYGFFITYFFYKYSSHHSIEYIIPWTIILFCMIMMPFTNAFNTFFTWIVLIINKLLLKQ